MVGYQLVERKPQAEEIIELRESVGWGIINIDSMQIGLDNSIYGVCAVYNAKVIGTARVIGDGVTVFYIQDVIVKPEFQGTGIGTALLKSCMKYISDRACNGAIVGLMSAKGKETFYEQFGFWRRPNENFGAGMMQFWERR